MRPIAESLPAGHDYLVVTPQAMERTPETSAFHAWLLSEAGQDA